MKKTILISFILLALVLAACSNQQTEKAVQLPAAQATEEQVVEPTSEVPALPAQLINTSWAWNSFSGPEGQEIVVDPLNYRLTFNDSNDVGVLADCNSAFAAFDFVENRLTVEIGPMTRVACLPESRSDVFLTYLGSAASYFFDGGNFFIELMADGGVMGFVPAGSVEVVADPGEMDSRLMDNDWQWVSLQTPVEIIEIGESERYHLTFQEDGLLEIVADCNNAHATYHADSSSMSIVVGVMTLAACPPDSRSDEFLNHLDYAAKYFIADGDLYIDLFADGGTMRFSPYDDSVVEGGEYEAPYYTVAKGDTLYSIGVRFGVPWENIASANGVQGTLIYVGQTLLIPEPGDVVTPVPDQGPAERVQFASGSIYDTRQGIINQGVPKSYVLWAEAGQTLTVSTESSGEPLVVSIGNTNGDLLPLTGTNSQLQNAVQAVLPETGDYIVTVRATTLPENPQLAFTIQFTIQ
jgi:heat shock protein HslJ/LysM repeat protein